MRNQTPDAPSALCQRPLVPARLIKRYKRFLADAELADGTQITAHCANPGAMTGLADPGTRIWLEPNDDPRKKLKYAWRLVEHETGHFTGVDTGLPNRLLRAALAEGTVPDLPAYDQVRPEQKYGAGNRIDFLLSKDGAPDTYLEVKSVTLSRQTGLAEFPDSKTARGARHLAALADQVHAGQRAVLLYLVQRTDCDRVALARNIDPAYAAACDAARAAGVTILAFRCALTPHQAQLGPRLQVM